MNNGRFDAGLIRNDPQEIPGPAIRYSGTAQDLSPGTDVSRGKFDGVRQSRPVIWMHAASPALVSPALTTLPINAEPGATARAILSEIKMCAERLVAQGKTHSIDLRFLKSTPDERATLVSLLGRGEVSAVVDSIGRSEIQETAIPCVWWIRHFNSEDEIVGELIEISDIPELLVGDREAVAFGLEALRARELSGAR